jgi:hypothetical protein
VLWRVQPCPRHGVRSWLVHRTVGDCCPWSLYVQTMMWIEGKLRNRMRAISRELVKSRIQRVSDIQMIAIKAAVESTTPAGTS